MTILEVIVGTFWLLLPAGFANMIPVLVSRFRVFSYPIDFGASLGGRRIFGDHKTVRGFVFGILAAIGIAYVQSSLSAYTTDFALLDYASINPMIFGLVIGCGALLGDSVKSFFKRRMGIASGMPWPPFDQVDWIVGAFLFLLIYSVFDPLVYVVGVGLFGLLHVLASFIGFVIGLKESAY